MGFLNLSSYFPFPLWFHLFVFCSMFWHVFPSRFSALLICFSAVNIPYSKLFAWLWFWVSSALHLGQAVGSKEQKKQPEGVSQSRIFLPLKRSKQLLSTQWGQKGILDGYLCGCINFFLKSHGGQSWERSKALDFLLWVS